jgi:hypothetical protein
MSIGPGVFIVNIILCNYVCFTHVTIIHNLLTYLLYLILNKCAQNILENIYLDPLNLEMN